MLAAEHRLRDSDAFRRTVRAGRRAGGSAVVVHLLTPAPPAQVHSVRVGLVVSKAVGNAVARNQVKRRLRHVVRPHLASLPAGAEVVVRALPPAAGLSSAELDAELTRCLSRAMRSPAAPRTGAAS
ncbi:ribonuclease P protein component [Nocardioides anomalus]|uniref:Ribonuclease P protein component n=1 Tax=Nocardioides anomalus TaxID=2712223 RepID=A0A6G6WIS0_9ACTN|nr:ribonuclease P protein component [Nocardioides anomalus]QIG45228.1 ribonuclease P protein component [Nocardioides anomalus]